MVEQGQHERARSRLDEAIELYAGLGPALDPRRGNALLELGRARLALGDDQAGIALEGAIALLSHRARDASALARARFALAQALLRPTDPSPATLDRARTLARDALAGLEEDDPLRPELESWLETKGR